MNNPIKSNAKLISRKKKIRRLRQLEIIQIENNWMQLNKGSLAALPPFRITGPRH